MEDSGIARTVATAVLGLDTLWGGDVMCPSGSGRCVADTWFSGEPLPVAYTHPTAEAVRRSGGVARAEPDRAAVDAYLDKVNVRGAIGGLSRAAEAVRGARGDFLAGRAACLQVMWDLVQERLGRGPVVPYARCVRALTGKDPEPARPEELRRQLADLLEHAGYPGRADLLNLLRAHVKGVAPLQSGSGLWHQMLDKTDTYLETSASAMFVFSIARAINRGWIAPVSYGPVAQAGWNGLATRVNDKGQVEGTCVSTTFASDNLYYYNRPASVYASHGYGPVLLAGAEMIRLVQNPAIDIQYKNATYHYVPKAP